jgi:AAA15 family ATPase/GTPase
VCGRFGSLVPMADDTDETQEPSAEATPEANLSQDHFIKQLTIENFKSIRKLELRPKRINLFVGAPNTGKSNILEGISILQNGIYRYHEKALRFEQVTDLFHNKSRKNICKIESISDKITNEARMYYDDIDKSYTIYLALTEKGKAVVKDLLHYNERSQTGVNPSFWTINEHKIIFYIFNPLKTNGNVESAAEYRGILQPYHGSNIHYIIETNPELQEAIHQLIAGTNLDLLLDTDKNRAVLQKRIANTFIDFPFYLIADTLQRQIFHLAALYTNRRSILLFEEPESHSFPPYVTQLAGEIAESKTNQFFIATHSPYLVQKLYEEAWDELQIYLTDYENHETTVVPLEMDWVQRMIESGSDIFFNLGNYKQS